MWLRWYQAKAWVRRVLLRRRVRYEMYADMRALVREMEGR